MIDNFLDYLNDLGMDINDFYELPEQEQRRIEENFSVMKEYSLEDEKCGI